MQSFNSVFVTVGTTQFDDLIDILLTKDVLKLMREHVKCQLLKIQYGAGKGIDAATIERIQQEFSIKVECYDFKANILSDIISSDLVISHAGAGSCIEVLTSRKPLVVVVNNNLMHNHQTELAQQLFNDRYLLYCEPSTLAKTLTDIQSKVASLQPYEPGHNKMSEFVNHLNTLMGFE